MIKQLSALTEEQEEALEKEARFLEERGIDEDRILDAKYAAHEYKIRSKDHENTI